MSESTQLLAWYDQIKRDLPWRNTKDPYAIWVSEIMLQQTRVETVKTYYRRFLCTFPTLHDLANAQEEEVLACWAGLGYYSRARNMQKAAQMIVQTYAGQFPSYYTAIHTLPGIGDYTAGAIASIAFGERVPAIDGNVNRVLTRFFAILAPIEKPSTKKEIHQQALTLLPHKRVGDFNQALMELGATLCSKQNPRCSACPWCGSCQAYALDIMNTLPNHKPKRPPTVIPLAVCLLTYQNQILVVKRSESLLAGLYVFWLVENELVPENLVHRLRQQGLPITTLHTLSTARHIFTHRVWDMTIFHGLLIEKPSDTFLQACDATLVHDFHALPFPTAMKAAKEIAEDILQCDCSFPVSSEKTIENHLN